MNCSSSLLTVLALMLPVHALAQGCFTSAVPVDFGTLDGRSTQVADGMGFVRLDCVPGIPFSIRLDAGENAGGDVQLRALRRVQGQETLRYNLYVDAGRTRVWGDGTSGTLRGGTSNGGTTELIVYGRIHGGQNPMVGEYRDSVTVTVDW